MVKSNFSLYKRYEEVVEKVMGPFAAKWSLLMVMFMQFGLSIGNILFAQDFLKFSSCSLGIEPLCQSQELSLFVGFCTTLPLLFITSDRYFRVVATIAFSSIVFTLLIIMGYSMSTLEFSNLSGLSYFKPAGFFEFYGVSLFIFEGVGLMFPIRYRINNSKRYLWVFTYISGADILFQMVYSTAAYLVIFFL